MPTLPQRIQLLLRLCSAPLALAAALAITPPAARALPVSGQLSVVGSLVLGATSVDFAPSGGGTGAFSVVDPSNGSFTGLAGTSGLVADLDLSPAQVGTPISLPGALVLAVLPATGFEITFLHAGAFSPAACAAVPAAGQTCTPPTSPALQLVNVPTGFGLGSFAAFSVTGTVQDGSDVSDFTGTFTMQFTQPYQNVLATLAGGGTVASSYSAVFQVVPVPEASTLAMCGLGAALLGAARGRRAPA